MIASKESWGSLLCTASPTYEHDTKKRIVDAITNYAKDRNGEEQFISNGRLIPVFKTIELERTVLAQLSGIGTVEQFLFDIQNGQ